MMISMKVSGIYTITNTVSGRVYVGKSLNIQHRFRCHKMKLREGRHENSWLQNAWNKYGEAAFSFEILIDMTGSSPDEIALAECQTGDLYKRKYNIMVITKEGQFSPLSVRLKIGAASKLRMNQPLNKERHIANLTAEWSNPEQREKRINSLRQAWQDPEIKAARLKATQDAQAKLMQDPNSKINQRSKKRWAANDARSKAASKAAEQWSDPEMKAKMRAACKAGWARRRERLASTP